MHGALRVTNEQNEGKRISIPICQAAQAERLANVKGKQDIGGSP